MKKTLTILGTIILSLVLTFLIAETFSLYHFGSIPIMLTTIYLISIFSVLEYIMLLIIYIVNKKIKKEKIELKKIIGLISIFISLLLILGFIITVNVDWLNYYRSGTSAPFYVLVIESVIDFLIPCSIFIIVSIYSLRKSKNKK